jgi:hypothetical protein
VQVRSPVLPKIATERTPPKKAPEQLAAYRHVSDLIAG